MTPVLEFRSVRSFYGNALVLDGVDLCVHEGECLALLGRNGVGKTTTLNTVFAVARVGGGEVLVDGVALAGRRYEAAQRGVALVPQGRRILPNLTVAENLLLAAAPGRPGRWDLSAVYELFPVLAKRARAPGLSLSGGEQQMLAIGRALMSNPRVILLDEPSEGLAPMLVQQLGDVLVDIRAEGTAMLIVEQRLELVRRLADRYLVMTKGRIVADGDARGLRSADIRRLIAV